MTGTADNELTQVLASAAAGDDVAFARIVAAYHGEMHRVCAFVCRDRAMAEDAVQAAWLIAWRKLGSIREPARLRPWLVTVAVNETKQLMRKRKRRSEIEIVADASGEPGGIDPATGLDSMAVREAMARLGAMTAPCWRCATWLASTPPSCRRPSASAHRGPEPDSPDSSPDYDRT